MIKKLLIFLILPFLFTCGVKKNDYIERTDLFKIPVGQMVNELNYLMNNKFNIKGTSRIFMKDGIFYITGSGNGKVMELTSYGDLLTVIYNSENSPPFVETLRESEDGEVTINQKIETWPFRSVSVVGASEEYIYAGDILSEEKKIWSEEQQMFLSHVILRFDRNGKFVDYIGQEGIGTIPFPTITDLTVKSNDDIVVTCRATENWQLFWFNSIGELLYEVNLNDNNLPFYKEGTRPCLYMLKPSPSEYKLFLQIDYIPETDTNRQALPESRLYTFDLLTEKYNKGIALPDNTITINKKEFSVPYTLIGITASDYLFFTCPVDSETYNLLITKTDSEVVARKKIRMKTKNIIYYDMYLSPDGILNMIAYYSNSAMVSWWRCDKLLSNDKPIGD